MKYSLPFILIALIFTGCTTAPTLSNQKSCINASRLNTYGFNHLEHVAKALREEKQNNKSFEMSMFVLNKTVSEYSDIFKSSAQISNVARFLPIPYAGEVCTTTKLISKTALNLGQTANAFNQYKQSSNTFLDEFDKLNRSTATSAEISKLAIYGDTKLLSDAKNLELSLIEISSSTATMASTMQSISEALETGNGYVSNMKSYVGMNTTASAEDKGKVAKNRNSMLTSLTQLNQKVSLLEKSGQVYRYNIAKARVYSELSLELGK
ncbi:MAG TPA: hypothetical protein PLM93_01695 [Sulfuricurvum sp.]|nr:MAG: hypothetical protein B7Y30_09110 [Campylobacterales bacterium 16-40-21]OZA03603.1 MAG: hypothetical protein B7X89_02750 [Sulfuricurvum sp. 17-40-25]HQS65883.1 hypothetical protein [Sulfuricurvum sp.]HQT36587.1 hypothetical protein [Sulfuricurvum sp.]